MVVHYYDDVIIIYGIVGSVALGLELILVVIIASKRITPRYM